MGYCRVLRPKVKKDRCAGGESPVFGRFSRRAKAMPTDCVEGVHRREERVDITGELLRIRPVGRWHSDQDVVAVLPDGFT